MKTEFLKPVVSGLIRYQVPMGMPIDPTVDMLLFRMSVMPVYLSFPMAVLTLMFDTLGILRCGRKFRSQSLEQQAQYIAALKKSRLGICKDFIGFYEKMGTFIYYAQNEHAAGG